MPEFGEFCDRRRTDISVFDVCVLGDTEVESVVILLFKYFQ